MPCLVSSWTWVLTTGLFANATPTQRSPKCTPSILPENPCPPLYRYPPTKAKAGESSPRAPPKLSWANVPSSSAMEAALISSPSKLGIDASGTSLSPWPVMDFAPFRWPIVISCWARPTSIKSTSTPNPTGRRRRRSSTTWPAFVWLASKTPWGPKYPTPSKSANEPVSRSGWWRETISIRHVP